MKTKEEKTVYCREWRIANREQFNETSRRYRKNNPEKIKSIWRKAHLKSMYNLSLEAYDELLKVQKEKCAICDKAFSELKKNPHIDHDHNTGQIRGLLCGSCNTKLGWYEKYKEQIEQYIVY